MVDTAAKTVTRYDSLSEYVPFGALHTRIGQLFDTLHAPGYKLEKANVVQQPNGVDCGIHTMLNTRALLERCDIRAYGYGGTTSDDDALSQAHC